MSCSPTSTGRAAFRDAEDRRVCLGARPDRDPARPFDAGRAHFSLAQSPIQTPFQEYLVKWNAINQHFLAHPIAPVRGEFAIRLPGLGMELDAAKIEAETEVYGDAGGVRL